MASEQINHLYRPQPVKPDQARARLTQDVGDAKMDAADRQPSGTSSPSNPISYTFSLGSGAETL